MRGTPDVHKLTTRVGGIIPAYAGNTSQNKGSLSGRRDHPRVCGEHQTAHHAIRLGGGSSPRMRGTRRFRLWQDCRAGIIPAYAGNTLSGKQEQTVIRDHPRVCGEHTYWAYVSEPCVGSSPRMRGTPVIRIRAPSRTGIIPAYAGNTGEAMRQYTSNGDHPRVCGEHPVVVYFVGGLSGSSPRMRGTLGDCLVLVVGSGIIPAYAGNTGFAETVQMSLGDHPRVCGEHLKMHRPEAAVWGSSPRMRGTRVVVDNVASLDGIIPAYAGNTLRDYSNFVVSKFMSFVFHLV